MLRKPRTIAFWVDRLPHWEVEEGRYFITLHLAGAIPQLGRERLLKLSDEFSKRDHRHQPDWLPLQRQIFREMERWLDRAEHVSHLTDAVVAEMVIEAIEHRNQRGDWRMFEYVIMPSHMHLFCEIGGHGMKWAIEDFKRWTGHRAAKILALPGDRF